MTASKAGLETAQMAQVPMTIEGASALHNMARFRWTAWRALPDAERKAIAEEAAAALAPAEEAGKSAIYSVLGHKADLMLVHFRDSFDDRPGPRRPDRRADRTAAAGGGPRVSREPARRQD